MTILFILIGISLSLVFIFLLYTRRPQFGRRASGERLEQMRRSPHFRDGKFRNLRKTPQFAEGYTFAGVLFRFLFGRDPKRVPSEKLPSSRTDILHLPADKDVLIWFGHSSYFMQIAGKKFLVDPVFSGNASPLAASNKAFPGTDIYTADDLPHIDVLLITHDHYDHLDYSTVKKLRTKTSLVICGLGVGAHLERWGYQPENIIEKDWYEAVELGDGFTITAMPARHFSGRSFSMNQTLWLSFVLQAPRLTLYLGGDSGYDEHFAEIGKRFGPIDLAMLDNGQYNEAWRYIHALPAEVLKAARDLRTKRLMPVHSFKFALANHRWDEPLTTLTELNKEHNIPLVTPLIGEAVDLHDPGQQFYNWWAGRS